MVAKTSVLEIDVKDEKFKEFQRLFEKYKSQLQQMPGDWAKVGSAVGTAGKAAGNSFLQSAQNAAKMQSEVTKTAKAQNDVTRNVKASNIAFKEVAKTTASIAKNVTNTTFQLLKWATLGGLLGAAGGFFGAGAIASSASNLRRESQGLTVTPGQLRAVRLNFGNYLDPESILGNISNAQTDLTKHGYLAGLGISGAKLNQSPAELLPELLPRLVQMFKQGGGTQQYYEAKGMNNIIDLPSLKRLSNLPAGELQGAIDQYQRDVKSTAIGDQALRTLQKLNNQFARAGDQIENVFIGLLSRVAPNLEHLSSSIVKALQTFSNNPNIGKWVDEFGTGIEKVAGYLNSDKFGADINAFIDNVGVLSHNLSVVASGIGTAFSYLGTAKDFISPGSDQERLGEVALASGDMMAASALMNASDFVIGAAIKTHGGKALGGNTSEMIKDKQDFLGQLEKQYGLPSGLLDKVWNAESSRGVNMISSAGAMGDFGIMPATAQEYGIPSGKRFDFYANAKVAAQKFSDLIKEYHGDTDKARAAYNAGQVYVNHAVGQYGANWTKGLPKETQDYLQRTAVPNVTITINNPAGANVGVSTSSMSLAQ